MPRATGTAGPVSAKHVGFIGRLEYQKDPCLFVEVVAHLPGYTATIVGGGALEAEVRAEIARRGLTDRIGMPGPLPHHETLPVLARLSAVVMTSRWEGLPILPLEAMWLGVPVVAVNVGGLSEIIEPGRHGILVHSRSATDLVEAVIKVTGELALRNAIIHNARCRVRALFSVDSMALAIRKVYESVLR